MVAQARPAKSFADALRDGDTKTLKREARGLERISGSRLSAAARAVSDYVHRIAGDKKTTDAVLKALGEAVSRKDGGEADAHVLRAAGELGLARLRRLRATGKDYVEPEVVEQALKACDRWIKASPDQGRALARGLAAVAEAAAFTEIDSPALLNRAGAYHKRLGKFGNSNWAVYGQATYHFLRARLRLGSARHAELREIAGSLEARMVELAKLAKKDVEFATRYNEAVAFVLANKRKIKFKSKPEFRAETYELSGLLDADVPMGRFWRPERRGVVQWDESGRFLRHMTIRSYSHNTEYTFEARGIGGDNPKGLCQFDYDDAKGYFAKIKRAGRVVKGRINRHLKRGYYFDVAGIDPEGDFIRVRSYFVKSEYKAVTINVYFVEFMDERKFGPGSEFFMKSLEES